MDDESVNYCRKRYDQIEEQLAKYLTTIGYDPKEVPFIPISGWQGDNLTERSTKMEWYQGGTLLETLDKIKPPKRPTDRPLRLPLLGVDKISGIGVLPFGRVESGVLRPGMAVTFAPAQITTDVKSVETRCESLAEALPFEELIQKIDKRTGTAVGSADDEVAAIKPGEACLVKLVPMKPMCVEPFERYAALGRFIVRDMRQVVAVGIVKSTEKGDDRGWGYYDEHETKNVIDEQYCLG